MIAEYLCNARHFSMSSADSYTNTGFGTSASSGNVCTLDSSTTDLTTALSDGDYIRLGGFSNSNIDGTYIVVGNPSGTGPWTASLRRISSNNCADEAAGANVTLNVSGGIVTTTLESGTPYRHYMSWVFVAMKVGAIADVEVQPLFGGAEDGSLVSISALGPTLVYKVTAEEVRPPTRGIFKHKDDDGPALPLKSELRIANWHTTLPLEITVYMMASAAPGGA